jgi:hypothetical protein
MWSIWFSTAASKYSTIGSCVYVLLLYVDVGSIGDGVIDGRAGRHSLSPDSGVIAPQSGATSTPIVGVQKTTFKLGVLEKWQYNLTIMYATVKSAVSPLSVTWMNHMTDT